ncbi:MAG: hypothetical protein V8T86_10795 [Victivallis sp.]
MKVGELVGHPGFPEGAAAMTADGAYTLTLLPDQPGSEIAITAPRRVRGRVLYALAKRLPLEEALRSVRRGLFNLKSPTAWAARVLPMKAFAIQRHRCFVKESGCGTGGAEQQKRGGFVFLNGNWGFTYADGPPIAPGNSPR